MQAPRSERRAPRLLATLALAACGAAWTPATDAQSVGTDVYRSPAYNSGVSDSASQVHGGCTVPGHRDASCLGWSGADGTRNTDNSALSLDPRGANARRVPGQAMPTSPTLNSCVAMNVGLWSQLGAPQSFVSQAGSGYFGMGGSSDPLASCASPTDGSCATWVPSTYKFLFLGGSSFVECGGNPSSGSVTCPVTGANAMVTTNQASGWDFKAYIVACRTGTADAGVKVNDAPFAWWSNCTVGGSSCSYVVYDATLTEAF